MSLGPCNRLSAITVTVATVLTLVGSLACSGEPTPTPPRDPTITEAQAYVPFPIQAPTYIPDGYEMEPHVSFLDSRHYGHEIKGVRFTLQKYTPRGYKQIGINQFLAEGTFPSTRIYLGEYIPREIIDMGGWEVEVGSVDLGRDVGKRVGVEWESKHEGKRIFYAVTSDVSLEETLKLVGSFRPVFLTPRS